MKKELNILGKTSDTPYLIYNHFDYINSETLKQCFTKGKTYHIDKVICGNGFSTAFLNSKPPKGKINILIAPNKAVVINKRNAHEIRKATKPKGLNKQKFFYGGSKEKSFKNADVLVFVVDSFLIYKERLKAIKDSINWVLIDEAHSVEIQSLFRNNLQDFTNKCREIVGVNASLSTVTATPLLFSKIDIKIKNDRIKKTIIHSSNDYTKALERIKELNKKGEKVLVATNSSNVIYRLRDDGNVLDANFNIGNSLMASVVEVCTVNNNDRSNLTIISSRGFEGFDIYGDGYNIFFFEDRSNEQETFFISNLYQALNRCRDGFKRVEYIRLELSSKRKEPFKNIEKSVKRFINRRDISVEQKQKTKYKEWHPFVIFDRGYDVHNFNIRINRSAVNLYKEKKLFDNFNNADAFDSFLKDRDIDIIKDFNIQNRLPRRKISEEKKRKNLKSNIHTINEFNLFGDDYTLSINTYDKKNQALKHLQTYLRRKNFDGRYVINEREKLALELLENDTLFYSVLKDIIKINKAYHLKKYGVKKGKVRDDNFIKMATTNFISLIQMFVNKVPNCPKKIIGHRDYNLITGVSVDVLNFVGDMFGFEVIEYDIRNCFPRLLYALNGISLPIDFYGVNKENKLKINIFLNDFMLDTKKLSDAYSQKKNAIKKFLHLGFDKKVIDFLMANFFETKFRGELFNFLSYYESCIIEKLQKDVLSKHDIKGIRRHDSTILFIDYDGNDKYDVGEILCGVRDFNFLGQFGWFVESDLVSIKKDLVRVLDDEYGVISA